jgi:hypothetical protein
MKTQRVAIGLTMLNLMVLMVVLLRGSHAHSLEVAAVAWRSWMTTGEFV